MDWYVYMILTIWGVICFAGCLRLCLMSGNGYCCKCYQRFRTNEILVIKQDFIDYPDSECPICLDEFTNQNPPYTISFCNNNRHPLHKSCILKNFQSGNIDCPICRATFPVPEIEV